VIALRKDRPFEELAGRAREHKRDAGLCVVKRCRCQRRPGRSLCERHKKQLSRFRNPERYAYDNLRRSAQMRGIRFEMSFEEWLHFIDSTDYVVELRGCKPGSLTVDRIDSSRGYTPDNIRPLEFLENSKRGPALSVDPF